MDMELQLFMVMELTIAFMHIPEVEFIMQLWVIELVIEEFYITQLQLVLFCMAQVESIQDIMEELHIQ